MRKKFPSIYERISRLIPIAAFNNLVIGVALIVNHQLALSLPGAVGLSLGACAGFLLLSWLTAEGMERLDNPDIPKAFRGLPSVLIYLGILALALMGFTGSVSLI
jgi:electron transport complex protein RnfA